MRVIKLIKPTMRIRRIILLLLALVAVGASAQVEREVTFSHDDVTLAGTVTLPGDGSGRYPAVVMVTGSGTQDRNETLQNLQPFKVIAEHLAACGIASLRYDDRGAGGSSPLTGSETTVDFAQDAEAALQFLHSYKHIDSSRIGILGHSEGGLIAFMIAGNDNAQVKPAFVVAIAAPALKGAELLIQQNIDIAEQSGMPMDAIQQFQLRQMFNNLCTINDEERLRIQLSSDMATLMPQLPREAIQQQLAVMTSPWFRSFAKYDPSQPISNTRCPALALYGEYDFQVNPEVNAKAMRTLNPAAQVVVLPQHNHMMQKCADRMASMNYFALGTDVSPEALEAMSSFINSTKP